MGIFPSIEAELLWRLSVRKKARQKTPSHKNIMGDFFFAIDWLWYICGGNQLVGSVMSVIHQGGAGGVG